MTIFFAALPTLAGLQENVRLDQLTPLSGNAELLRRLYGPLTVALLQESLKSQGKSLATQAIDPSTERFTLYIPETRPPAGYGVLVFIPPWEDSRLPRGWGPVMDEFGMIFVSAERSGNGASVVNRREPLALIGLASVRKLYNIDESRIVIAGFSGGSRVAQRLALAYPDLFRGAVLNAGSDPIGGPELSPPPEELLEVFQKSSHIVQVTGSKDELNVALDKLAADSMKRWCVAALTQQPMNWRGHEPADSASLARALRWIFAPAAVEESERQDCLAARRGEMQNDLREFTKMRDKGDRVAAEAALKLIDQKYGGLDAAEIFPAWKSLNKEAQ